MLFYRHRLARPKVKGTPALLRLAVDLPDFGGTTDAMILVEYADPRARAQICESILRALPDWFGIESALLQYVREAAELPMFVAVDATAPVGFITLHQHGPAAWEIHAVGVLPDHHRRGLGRRLLEEGERWLRTHDAEFLTVKTLSASSVRH